MDMATILADAQIILALGKLAVQVGMDAAPYIEQAYDIVVLNKPLSDADRQAAIARQAVLEAQIATAFADDGAGA
jgi:predicted phosphoribosyltransferase